MATSNVESFWFLESDGALLDKGVYIEEDYLNSDIPSVKLWNPQQELQAQGRIVRYKARKPESYFRTLDYMPGSTSLPVVSDHMKNVFEAICNPSEVAFRPSEVHFPNGVVKRYWNLCPLIEKRFVDEDRTDAAWWVADLPPFERTIKNVKSLVLKRGDAGDLFRLKENPSSLVISRKIKEEISSKHLSGFVCILPHEVRFGI